MPGTGWVRTAPYEPCRTCGATLPARKGRGGRRAYCDEHAPAARASLAAWQAANRDRLRELERARSGCRPMRDYLCSRCGTPARGYVDTLCRRCRRLRKDPSMSDELEAATAAHYAAGDPGNRRQLQRDASGFRPNPTLEAELARREKDPGAYDAALAQARGDLIPVLMYAIARAAAIELGTYTPEAKA